MGTPLVAEATPSTPRRRGFWSRSTRGQQSSGAPALHLALDAQVSLHRGSVIDKVKTGNWTKDADLEGQQEEHRAGQVCACTPLPARRRAVWSAEREGSLSTPEVQRWPIINHACIRLKHILG